MQLVNDFERDREVTGDGGLSQKTKLHWENEKKKRSEGFGENCDFHSEMATTLNKTLEFNSCAKDGTSGISKQLATFDQGGVSVLSEKKEGHTIQLLQQINLHIRNCTAAKESRSDNVIKDAGVMFQNPMQSLQIKRQQLDGARY